MPIDRRRLRRELRRKLADYSFDYFVTLSSNFGQIQFEQMRDRLKRWDARCNRQLNQSRWAKRPDERLLWFAFIEKVDVNPHWHLLVQLDPSIEGLDRKRRASRFPIIAAEQWKRQMPSGTFDCQHIDSGGVLNYVTKCLHYAEHLERFICSREFVIN